MSAPAIIPLDCGWLRTQQRTLLAGGTTEMISIPVPAWLIRHDAGDVVFDTGLHPALAFSPSNLGSMSKLFEPMIAADGSVGRRLEEHDVDPTGTFRVVLSHCHFDHVGGLCDLPNALVVVQATEWAAATSDAQPGGYNSALIDLGHDVQTVDGEHDLFGDGTVLCVPTPGHTCGHQSLRVLTETGPVILAADACYFAHTLDDGVRPPFGHDLEQQRQSLELLRREQRNGTTIIPGHDAPSFNAALAAVAPAPPA